MTGFMLALWLRGWYAEVGMGIMYVLSVVDCSRDGGSSLQLCYNACWEFQGNWAWSGDAWKYVI